MKLALGISALGFAALFSGCAKPIAPAPAPMPVAPTIALLSPWDVSPRPVTDRPFECGPPALLAPDIEMGEVDDPGRHLSEEVKNAAYANSTTALLDAMHRVVEAADNFQATGSRAAAACVTFLLSGAAENRAMTGYVVDANAMKKQNLALRAFAIAYLKTRPAHTATPEQQQMIAQWMIELAREGRSYWDNGKCSATSCAQFNKSGNQAAVAAMEVGIAAQDQALVHYAIEHYKSVVGLIDRRGMVVYDMHHDSALAWNLKTAASLVEIAELAETNHIPLYGYDNGRIHLMVHTVAMGLVSPSIYGNITHEKQNVSASIEPWEVVWASVYNRRFPDPVMTGLLNSAGSSGADMWGGDPWQG